MRRRLDTISSRASTSSFSVPRASHAQDIFPRVRQRHLRQLDPPCVERSPFHSRIPHQHEWQTHHNHLQWLTRPALSDAFFAIARQPRRPHRRPYFRIRNSRFEHRSERHEFPDFILNRHIPADLYVFRRQRLHQFDSFSVHRIYPISDDFFVVCRNASIRAQ